MHGEQRQHRSGGRGAARGRAGPALGGGRSCPPPPSPVTSRLPGSRCCGGAASRLTAFPSAPSLLPTNGQPRNPRRWRPRCRWAAAARLFRAPPPHPAGSCFLALPRRERGRWVSPPVGKRRAPLRTSGAVGRRGAERVRPRCPVGSGGGAVSTRRPSRGWGARSPRARPLVGPSGGGLTEVPREVAAGGRPPVGFRSCSLSCAGSARFLPHSSSLWLAALLPSPEKILLKLL